MKLDRVIWGILLLFIGGVILLDNFEVIEFYWRNVWSFWPVFLIILGVNILFNRNNSQAGNIISLGILIVTLGFLFVKGQSEPENRWWWDRDKEVRIHGGSKWEMEGEDGTVNYATPFLAGDAEKRTILNINGGASTYELKGESDSLFEAKVLQHRKGMRFMLNKEVNDSINKLTFKTSGKNGKFNFGEGENTVAFYLNLLPTYEVNLAMGAGKIDFDLSKHKVRVFKFDGGAADIAVKFGDLLPITDVTFHAGMANIDIEIPAGSGCRIKTRTGLSSKEFEGFTKLKDGTYESPNYQGSAKKIFITLDGGLSNFEVRRN